jgi:serine protease
MPDAAHLRPARRPALALARLAALSLATLSSALLALPAGSGPGPARETRSAAVRAPLGPVAGEVIVKFKPGAALTRQYALSSRRDAGAVRSMLAERASTMGARLGHPLQAGAAVGTDIQVLRASGISAADLAARLAADPEVEFAEPNERMRRTAAPNDPLYGISATERRSNGTALQDGPTSGQWYLRAPAATLAQGPVSSIDIEAAWARTRGNASVVVAVLDTGVRPEHPDLVGRMLPGYDFVSNATVANDGSARDADPSDPGDWVTSADAATSTFSDCDVSPSSWHGTSTSSLVGAKTDDSNGMAGAAPGVTVLPVRVLGKCYGDSGDIQAAMRWAAGIAVDGVPVNPNPAKVLNLSLGGSSATCSAGYQSAVNEVLARGVVIVVAAGNSGGGLLGSPANCQGVIAVAGLRHAGLKVGFSDLGTQISIAAPAGNCVNIASGSSCLYPILAATNSGSQGPIASGWTNSYDTATYGTSFAAPLVAATAGLMFSVQPALTPAQLRAQLQATARPFPTTGGDNGDGSVVPQCVAPRTGVDQFQCYCNTTYCGAGMLDAGRAVAAAAGAVAVIAVTTTTPTAGSAVALASTGSLPAEGATLVGYQWSLTSGGGIVTGFTSATNASTASLTPSAAGSFTVTLAVTDSRDNVALATQTVTVAAATVATPPPAPNPADPPSGGGGSMSLLWLAALAAAVVALFRCAAPRPAHPAPRKA